MKIKDVADSEKIQVVNNFLIDLRNALEDKPPFLTGLKEALQAPDWRKVQMYPSVLIHLADIKSLDDYWAAIAAKETS